MQRDQLNRLIAIRTSFEHERTVLEAAQSLELSELKSPSAALRAEIALRHAAQLIDLVQRHFDEWTEAVSVLH